MILFVLHTVIVNGWKMLDDDVDCDDDGMIGIPIIAQVQLLLALGSVHRFLTTESGCKRSCH